MKTKIVVFFNLVELKKKCKKPFKWKQVFIENKCFYGFSEKKKMFP